MKVSAATHCVFRANPSIVGEGVYAAAAPMMPIGKLDAELRATRFNQGSSIGALAS